MFRILSIYSAC